MNRILFFFILVTSISSSAEVSAQWTKGAAKIDWSAPFNEPPKSFLDKIIHSDSEGFYGLRLQSEGISSGKADVFVEYYTKADMNLRMSKSLDLEFKNKTRDFEDVVMMKGGNMYFLTSFNNQAKKKNYLFAQPINLKNLRVAPRLNKIAEVATRNAYQEGGFRSHISKDTSKILVYAMLPRKKRQPERFSLQVFDHLMNPLWSKEITLPFNDDNFAVEEYRVDNEGNVYMLGVIYEDKSKFRRSGKPTYQYTLLAYRKNGEEVKEYKVNLGDKFITDLTYRVARNGDLVFSGFYSDKGTYSVKGTYFFRLNPETKEISNKSLKAFDFKFLTQYMSPNKREKAQKANRSGNKNKAPELYQYALDELILRSDGGAVLVAEQYFVEQRFDNNRFNDPYGFGGFYGGRLGWNRWNRWNNPYWAGNFQDQTYFYNYNDIIVVNIKPTGEIEWTARIPKQQVTTNDGGYFSSYAMSIVRDKFYFVFNDNPKNYDPNTGNKLFNYNGRNSVITLAEVNKDGGVAINPVFDNREAGITTRPKICQQVGRNEMLIYGERGRTYRFGSLKF
ncbi:MAG: hypothetical protein AAF960_07805 [Bacteroidota bacterium]